MRTSTRGALALLVPLFTLGTASATPGDPWERDPARRRTRDLPVTVEQVASLPEQARIRIGLFDGRRVLARHQRSVRCPDGFTWLGRLDDDPQGYVALAIRDGAVVGVVRTHGELYRVRERSGGGLVLYECDTASYGGCDGADPVPQLAPTTVAPRGAPASTSAPSTMVDVIVAWTQEAENAIGGVAAVLATIDLAVLETNVALVGSEVAVEVRLAYAARVNYTESGDMKTDLDRLQLTNDGFMDEVHVWRDAYGADSVALLVDNNTKCGRAYNMGAPATTGFAPWAFSLVSKDCVTGYYALAHELGHGFGLDHDRPNTLHIPSRPYAYGYRTANDAWYTIMALDPAGTATRVQYFSNPDIEYAGQALGTGPTSPEPTNAALALDVNAPIFSSFRAATTVTYCTPGTSASGCQARISATGIPSATAQSGFELVASGVEGAKDGIFFIGSNGRLANPWGSGSSYRCVAPPVARGGLLDNIGKSGNCEAYLQQDWNALWCPGCPRSSVNPGSGVTVQAQLWYRDPFNTASLSTSLSDAIEFVMRP